MAAVVLIAFGDDRVVFAVTTATLAAACFAISLRSAFGLDGAHQMYLLIFSAAAVSRAFGDDSPVLAWACWFLVLQLVVCYAVSGIAKLRSPIWRSAARWSASSRRPCTGTPASLAPCVERRG